MPDYNRTWNNHYRNPVVVLRCQVPLCLQVATCEAVVWETSQKIRLCAKHEKLNVSQYFIANEVRPLESAPVGANGSIKTTKLVDEETGCPRTNHRGIGPREIISI